MRDRDSGKKEKTIRRDGGINHKWRNSRPIARLGVGIARKGERE